MIDRTFLRFFPLSFLLVFAISCGNNPKNGRSTDTKEKTDSISGIEQSPDTFDSSIDKDTMSVEELSPKKELENTPPPNYSSLPGPVGFVIEKNLILREKPNVNSNKIASLKEKETVYILETSMVGDNGAQTQYPTWYRIESKNKERGWVKASGISSGH